jgi:hypothetical protein
MLPVRREPAITYKECSLVFFAHEGLTLEDTSSHLRTNAFSLYPVRTYFRLAILYSNILFWV